MWVTKQTMIAATTMMWMAEALGYDTGPMEGFDEDKVREVLGVPEHVRVLFLLALVTYRVRMENIPVDFLHLARFLPNDTVNRSQSAPRLFEDFLELAG